MSSRVDTARTMSTRGPLTGHVKGPASFIDGVPEGGRKGRVAGGRVQPVVADPVLLAHAQSRHFSGPLAGQALALQRTAGNQAVAAAVNPSSRNLQRSVAWDSSSVRLTKSGRFDFDPRIQQALLLGPQQARCHTVSYEEIVKNVIAPINACLAANPPRDVALGALDGLIRAVFPHPMPAGMHVSNPPLNQQLLYQLSALFRAQAEQAVADIALLVRAVGSVPISPQTRPNLEAEANSLIKALNNSPANLRPGNTVTNSSIQGALDLTQDPNRASGPLPPNAVIVNAEGKRPRNPPPGPYIFVLPAHERVVKTLLEETYSGSGGELTAFSSGARLQSSDNVNQTSVSMNHTSPHPIAIPWKNNTWFVFDT